MRILPRPSGGNDHRCNRLSIKIKSVIQAGTVDRRRPARVLCGAEDNDGSGFVVLLEVGRVHDAEADDENENAEYGSQQNDGLPKPVQRPSLRCW
jgi:hypothetical protein